MKKPFLGVCLFILLSVCGCTAGPTEAPPSEDAPPIVHVAAPPETAAPQMEITPEPENAYCSFSDGLDRFIACYNRCCTAHGNSNLLKDSSAWRENDGCWYYKQFEGNWLEPEYWVFTASSGAVQEIRIGFEDHGYTEWGEALSEERAFYTLRCLCPEQSDDELRQVIADVVTAMKTEPHYIGADETPDGSDSVPCGDYRICHYFSGGVYQFCILAASP